MQKFNNGKSTSKLTGTDSLSRKTKSWALDEKAGGNQKDDKSFSAFKNPETINSFCLRNDTLVQNNLKDNINGKGINRSKALQAFACPPGILTWLAHFQHDPGK